MKNKTRASSVSRLPSSVYLVWLEWPEKCFRIDAETLRLFRRLVGDRGRVVCARSERAFLRALPQATHALVWNFKEEWFAKASCLKVLATPAAGQEFVPTKGPKGVKIHFGSFHGEIMSETVAAFMLAWRRGFFRLREKAIANDPWPRTWLSDKCSTVAGTEAVIFGFGNVGRAIGAKLSALGVEVVGVTRHGIFRSRGGDIPVAAAETSPAVGLRRQECRRPALFDRFPSVWRSADWVILALPSTTGTDNFFDAKLIRKLPRKCVVINVGRGNAVDERALYRALKTKRLAGAYLDVRKHEPSATVLESPGYVPELADLPNCIVTPHSAAFDAKYLHLFLMELLRDRCL